MNQPDRPQRPQRLLTLPSGEVVMADNPDAISYSDDEIAALGRGLDETFGPEIVDLASISPAARAKLARRAAAAGTSVADVVAELVERHA